MEFIGQALKFVYCIGMVLLLFNLTIFVHEYGHYLLARWRGLKVETFAIWFGPAIWRRKIGGIEYVLGSIPLGGYVKLPQLQPDDPIEGKSGVPKEKLPYARPIDRIPTLFAGSLFNFLFAILIACVLWVVGIPVPQWMTDTTIGYVPEQSVEHKAGLQPGDRITSIDGAPVANWIDIRSAVILSPRDTLEISVQRDGKTESFQLKPSRDNLFGVRQLEVDPNLPIVVGAIVGQSPAEAAGLRIGDHILTFSGAEPKSIPHLTQLVAAGADKACEVVVDRDGTRTALSVTPRFNPATRKVQIGIGFTDSDGGTVLLRPTPVQQITEVVVQMAQIANALFHHKQTGVGVDDFSGPIGIVDQLYQAVAKDFRLALKFLILLNVNLAILNLLPLPVLDGGHIVFTLIEWVRRKPMNARFMEAVQTTFVFILLAFILYVSFNDVVRTGKLRGWFSRGESGHPAPAEAAQPGK